MGIVSSLLGIVIIMIAGSLRDKKDNNRQTIVASLLMLVSLVFQGLQRVYEEHLALKVETKTSRFIGLEGAFGLFFVLVFQGVLLVVTSDMQEDTLFHTIIKNMNGAKALVAIGKSRHTSVK